jgi:hypothetical protein
MIAIEPKNSIKDDDPITASSKAAPNRGVSR